MGFFAQIVADSRQPARAADIGATALDGVAASEAEPATSDDWNEPERSNAAAAVEARRPVRVADQPGPVAGCTRGPVPADDDGPLAPGLAAARQPGAGFGGDLAPRDGHPAGDAAPSAANPGLVVPPLSSASAADRPRHSVGYSAGHAETQNQAQSTLPTQPAPPDPGPPSRRTAVVSRVAESPTPTPGSQVDAGVSASAGNGPMDSAVVMRSLGLLPDPDSESAVEPESATRREPGVAPVRVYQAKIRGGDPGGDQARPATLSEALAAGSESGPGAGDRQPGPPTPPQPAPAPQLTIGQVNVIVEAPPQPPAARSASVDDPSSRQFLRSL